VAKLRTVGKMVLTRSALCGLTMATALLAAGCQQVGPTARPAAPTPSGVHVVPTAPGLVVGQISPCSGPPRRTPPPPAHPAGTVVVLRGSIEWIPDGRGGQSLGPFPTETVATESIPADGTYQFTLPPGPYVIVYPPYSTGSVPGGPTISIAPYASVSVVAGQTKYQDVPDPELCY
jgi:hypothetical protein